METDLFDGSRKPLPGLDLREQEQLNLVARFQSYYEEQPFPIHRKPPLRYFFENDFFSYSDGLFLHSMLRFLRPQKVIEVGAGYSSCVLLDTNDLFLENTTRCTIIDPYPENLRALIGSNAQPNVEIMAQPVQSVPTAIFESLRSNDILFIDSTHVSKTGSDVNRLLLEVLPILAGGVYVHFHDIFYPFEYPRTWVYEGRNWNEAYLIRAFLAFNQAFEISLFGDFIVNHNPAYFEKHMPLFLRNSGGSLWLRKIANP